MEKPKTYRSPDNVVGVIVIVLLALLWMLSPFYQRPLEQQDLVEFKGVVSSAPRVERSGKTGSTVRLDLEGVASTFSLNTYAHSALRPGFVTSVDVGDTVILGVKKDMYDRRILGKEERSMLGGKYIEVFTVATPSASFVTVDSFNAVKGDDQRIGWVVAPLVLAYLAFTWFTKRRLNLSR